jgi:hypothetical protein
MQAFVDVEASHDFNGKVNVIVRVVELPSLRGLDQQPRNFSPTRRATAVMVLPSGYTPVVASSR